jgi:diaminopimelate decarboxylase
LLVFDEDEMRERMRTVRALFPRVSYAVKAFTARRVLRMAVDEGLDLLCASGGEVEACLRAGVPAERVQLHGNAKTDQELSLAASAGLGLVIVDSPQELERLNEASRAGGRVIRVLLRVIPEVEVQTHEAIATGHAESKFGTPLGEAPPGARRAASLPGLSLQGFHAHAGSQVIEVLPYVRVLESMAGVAGEAGIEPRILDVGGGFGVTYTDESPLPVARLAEALETRAAGLAAEHGWSRVPEIQVEPGRALVANAGLTIYTVLGRKRVGDGKTLVAVDGGMSDNLRPMLYDARYTVAAASRASVSADSDTDTVTVVGRHCESGDVLVPQAELPANTDRGDLLAVAATGAYTYSLASNYNRSGRPAVVGVAGGKAELWLRREDAEDMDRLDVSTGEAQERT